ncbi:hypothetical protein ACHHV8_36620 [Paenibacillus sp. TAB 01]|uniref:hypothetical protein n=1 Tax=Paenibacillus sp. TAB 01 TaxID=3368988 RepID=UPI003751685E
MDVTLILSLAKEGLGIRTAVRDTYLAAIAEAIVKELTDEKGIELDPNNASHLMFCADYTAWRYQSRDSSGAMPRHLQFRLHNLMIQAGRGGTI